jgi:hypothetical protein
MSGMGYCLRSVVTSTRLLTKEFGVLLGSVCHRLGRQCRAMVRADQSVAVHISHRRRSDPSRLHRGGERTHMKIV